MNMKQKLFYSIFALLVAITTQAQQAIGSWRAHLSYHNATQAEPAGSQLYCLANGDLFSYDKEDTSIRTYYKSNPLSDTDISYIAYSAAYKTLIIAYSNANIDLLVNDENVYNLPDYLNKNMTQSKDIRHISFSDEYAYLSTSFGVIVINIKKKEISNAYILNKKVNACVVNNNRMYAATNEGLFTGLLTDNLLDVNNWKKASEAIYSSLTIYNKELVGNITDQGIYLINKEDYSYSQLAGGYYTFLLSYADKLLAGNAQSLYLFDNLTKRHYMDHNLDLLHLCYSNGIYWSSRGEKGLVGLKYNEASNQLEEVTSPIIPNSPKRNLPYYMAFTNERLLITGGGQVGDRLNRPGTILMLDENTWSDFEETGISQQTGHEYKDITSLAQDPLDAEHHFASSAGEGIYEFRNQKFIKNYSMHNSPLESAVPGESAASSYVRISGLRYDRNNNLWMLNSSPKNNIHVLKPTGEWVTLDYREIGTPNNFEHTLFDKRGWLWAVSSWVLSYGIFCVDTNRTLEDSSDDRHRYINRFMNQDGTLLEHTGIYCITEDKDENIWIGTGQGPIVINNPTKFFEEGFRCTQIKVPRNDGTNLADFLLANDIINDIAVDGANRKWIGTETNGLYLLSADGLETIHHFTAENSPLLSNSITGIAIHPRTGEVFIGTSKGLISYQSDATEAGESFSEDIYAYPNPVKPDYSGVITVTGLVRDSDVRITNVSGKLMYKGTSVGGQFTWDGRNEQGRRVSSGIYFVLAADAEGKEGVVTKIAFIQ